MSELINNSTPAERAVGCKFSETFETAQAVVANGGVITGSPLVDNGITLDGTNDHVTYALGTYNINNAGFSAVVEFNPSFEDDDANRFFFDTGTTRNYFYKASTNNLVLYLNGTLIVNLAWASYSAYWLVNQRNVLVVSSETGDTNIWLNGTQIVTNDNTAYSSNTVDTLYAGSNISGSADFYGTINSIKLFESLLTAQDAQNFYDNSTYDYMNDTVVNLQMRGIDHDPSATDGVELLVDGDCENAGTSDWISNSAAVLSKETGTRTGGNGTQVLKVKLLSGDVGAQARQNVLTAGKKYRFTGWVRTDGVADDARIYIGSSNQVIGTSTTWTYFDVIATTDDIYVLYGVVLGAGTSDAYCEIDDLSVELIEEKTLDVSGNDNHGMLGDGATPSKMPTKLQKHGYNFDGSDYIEVDYDTFANVSTDGFTMMFLGSFDSSGGVRIFESTNDANNGIAISTTNDTQLRTKILKGGSDFSPPIISGNYLSKLFSFAITWDGTTRAMSYLNGRLLTTSPSSIGLNASNPNKTFIGCSGAATGGMMDGEYNEFIILPDVLTPLQVADLHLRMMKQVNDI